VSWLETVNYKNYPSAGGHMVVQWLRHCAASWKVAGLRPDEVN
jgi:hypothetical protein